MSKDDFDQVFRRAVGVFRSLWTDIGERRELYQRYLDFAVQDGLVPASTAADWTIPDDIGDRVLTEAEARELERANDWTRDARAAV